MPQWLIDAILKLWNEARNIEYIAAKLNLVDEATGEYDIERVLNVVEDPTNYPCRREYRRLIESRQSL